MNQKIFFCKCKFGIEKNGTGIICTFFKGCIEKVQKMCVFILLTLKQN